MKSSKKVEYIKSSEENATENELEGNINYVESKDRVDLHHDSNSEDALIDV